MSKAPEPRKLHSRLDGSSIFTFSPVSYPNPKIIDFGSSFGSFWLQFGLHVAPKVVPKGQTRRRYAPSFRPPPPIPSRHLDPCWNRFPSILFQFDPLRRPLFHNCVVLLASKFIRDCYAPPPRRRRQMHRNDQINMKIYNELSATL